MTPRSASGGRSSLDVEEILRRADAYRAATGRWPEWGSGPVAGRSGETWSGFDAALRRGRRGLAGGVSLAKLLLGERGVAAGANPEAPADRLRAWEAEQFPARRPKRRRSESQPRARTRLTIDMVLAAADAEHARTGRWPRSGPTPMAGHPELSWSQVNRALVVGSRGLPGGTTLADLLQDRRGVRNKQNLPRLDVEEILTWADAFLAAHGEYPQVDSGPVRGVAGETWSSVQSALFKGLRGLPGGSSIALLLAERRGYRGPLTVDRILAWADAHRAATGQWPTSWSSGSVRGEIGESWPSINDCLRDGRRGLPGGATLAQLLAEHRDAPNIYTEAPLSVEQILAWADANRAATGRWPSSLSGPVLHAEGEQWGSIDTALREGYRGLPGGQAVGRLVREHAGPDAYRTRPLLDVEQILAWADAHRAATGRWPVEESGPVAAAPGESWAALSLSLQRGHRGLPGGSSLARLLDERRGVRNLKNLPHLTVEQILGWADAHRAATGRWPDSHAGPVRGVPDELWFAVDAALRFGRRGLPGGLSLARFLRKHRGATPSPDPGGAAGQGQG